MAGRPVVVLGVTGGIGAMAAPAFVLSLRHRLQAEVRVLVSDAAQRFVTLESLRAVTDDRVCAGMFASTRATAVPHVDMTAGADVLVVVPTTANTLGKIAAGIADELVPAAVMAARCPVILAPAMNMVMWRNPIVQRNVDWLRDAGYTVLDPVEGLEVATTDGVGAVVPPFEQIIDSMSHAMAPGACRRRVG